MRPRPRSGRMWAGASTVIVLTTLLACRSKVSPDDDVDRVAPTPSSRALASAAGAPSLDASAAAVDGAADATGDVPRAPASTTLALPPDVGPPPPFDQLRRWQKRSDVLAALGGIVREATPAELRPLGNVSVWSPWSAGQPWMATSGSGSDSDSDPVYATPLSGIFVQFVYADHRLAHLVFLSADGPGISRAVRARWGDGTVETSPGFEQRVYTPSAGGWAARLETRSEDTTVRLDLEAVMKTVAGPASIAMFAEVGKLIGLPLAAGKQTFGDAFVLELADEAEAGAERAEVLQGYMDVVLPWTESEWSTVVRVDQKTGRVVQATITGDTDTYEERVELMKQLKSAFGAPQPIITEAGYQTIGFFTKTLAVTLTDDDPSWTIEIHRR